MDIKSDLTLPMKVSEIHFHLGLNDYKEKKRLPEKDRLNNDNVYGCKQINGV